MTRKTVRKTTKRSGIRVRSRVKAGAIAANHNQATKGLRVKSRVKAGAIAANHNHTAARRVA